MSLKFVPKNPIDNIPALVQTMAWRRPGDKPLSQPMMRKYSRWHISYNNAVIGLDFQLRFWYGIHKRIYFT